MTKKSFLLLALSFLLQCYAAQTPVLFQTQSRQQIRDIPNPSDGNMAFVVPNNGAPNTIETWQLVSTSAASDDGVNILRPTIGTGRWYKLSSGSGGSGDFTGPSSSTNNNLVSFSGTTGKTGQDSGISTDGSGGIIAQKVTVAGSGSPSLVMTNGSYTFTLAPNGSQAASVALLGPASGFAGLAGWDNSSGTMTMRAATLADATNVLALTGSTSTFLRSDGTQAAPTAGLSVLSYQTTATGPSNTVTETTIFTNTITGGTMGTQKAYVLHLPIDIFNNSGSARTFTLKVYHGGTVIYNDASGNIAAQSAHYPAYLEMRLQNTGSASAQAFYGFFALGAADAATTGIGGIGNGANPQFCATIGGTSSKDTSSAQGFGVTVTLSAADANYAIKALAANDEIH